ncbi:conjugal transfer protein TrbL [Microbacterium sp. JB110]|uniref:conjugal transfer protein TrbL n=1 Tax=Microbacterium sp. JB110 TaxID=2024477 RepID=UPI00097ECAE3|nr:conjugal transfer protein TrbL [Microbacterium sp. JB110]RCS62123.1 conjugal transfer protein TrbL [Microbacterium sp. JB110]SJM53390.1 putative ATP-binding protein [Frigoribacterium sp. JB110]
MSICDVPVISSVCDAVGEGTASLIAAPFDWLGQAMAGAAAWLFEAVWWVFDTTTLVDVTSAEYVGVYNVLFGVAIFVMLVFFCLQLITGLIHRDPTALSRAALGLAKSVLGSFLVITLTALLLEVTDQLAVGIVQATGNTMEGMGTQIGLLATGLAGINIAAPGVGAILTIFLAGLAISAAAIVWFSLLIRKALLLVAIVFGPIALAGATWDATKGWFGKWAAFVIALIFSKLVLVVIFLVAIGQVSAPIEADLASISDPIAGVVLMFIAAFAPYITYKFLSFVGFDMYHAMSSEQEAKSALNRPVPVPGSPKGDSAKKVLDGGSDHGGKPASAGGGGGGTPPPSGAPAASAGAGAPAAATGAGAGAGAGAAGAGPVGAAVVVGGAVVKGAATAGPKAGSAVGRAAEGHAAAATEQASPPPVPPTQANPAPTTPPPSTAPRRSQPAPPPACSKPSGKE